MTASDLCGSREPYFVRYSLKCCGALLGIAERIGAAAALLILHDDAASAGDEMAQKPATPVLLCVGVAALAALVLQVSRGDRDLTARYNAEDTSTPRAKADALADTKSTANWDPVLNAKGVRVWKRVEHAERTSAPMAIKSSVYAAVPPRFFTDLLLTRDYDTARLFNPTLDGGSDIEWFSKHERISHVRTKPVLILKPRDFVVRVRRESRIDGTELVLNANTVHRLAPVAQSHVRGVLNGLHLVELSKDRNGCVYTMVSQMDPRGSIPMVIVNWFAMRRPLQYMVALRDLVEERYGRAEGVEAAAPAAPRRGVGRLFSVLRRGARRRARRIK